jgi:dihydrofolate reductase
MARKIIIYIATSLNSKIAAKDGSVEWLEAIPHQEGEDYGYQVFYDRIDTTIMGYATYAQLKSWDIPFPYKDKQNFVVTRKKGLQPDEHVEFVTEEHIDFFTALKSRPGKDIWLVGGGAVNTLFLNAGLVDELIVHVMPIVLDGGIDIFTPEAELKPLSLQHGKSYASGVQELHYKVNN